MKRSIRRRFLAFAAVAIGLIVAPGAEAQSVWNNAAGGSWNDPTAWTPNGVPNGAGAAATFGSAATGSVNITLASDVVAGTITFDSVSASGAYNIGSSGRTITMVSATGIAGAQIIANSNVLGLVNPQRFVAGQTLQVADLGGLTVTDNGLTVIEFAGPVTLLNNGPLIVAGSGSLGVKFDAGTLSGTGGLTKNGSTLLTLTGAQTGFTGPTTINAGVVAIDNANSLGADPAAVVSNQLTLAGGTLRDTTVPQLSLGANRGVRVNSGGGTFEVSSSVASMVIGGAVSGNGPITKIGPGTLILNGGNGGYAGTVAVNAGPLQLVGLSALGNANATTIAVANGAELQLNGGIGTFTSYPLTIAGTGSGNGALNTAAGSNTWTGPITLAANALMGTANNATPLTLRGGINVNGNQLSLGNATTSSDFSTFTVGTSGFSGTGSLVFDTGFTGTVTIPASSGSFTGPTTIRSGTVTLQNALGLGTADGTANTGISVAADTVLQLTNDPTSEHPGPVAVGNKPLTLTGSFLTSNEGSLVGQGPGNSYAGAITLTSPTTITAAQFFTAGGLTLSGGISAGGNLLTLNADTTSIVTVTTAGITGTAGLTKIGAGTAQLAIASTYSGTTTVSAGRLLITNPTGSATGTSTVTVASGGTLAGGNGGTSFADSTQGFLGGPVTVQSGGILAPGNNGVGLLTTTGAVALQTGSTLAVDIATQVHRPGSTPADVNTNDRLHTGSTLSFGTTLTLAIDGDGRSFTAGTYDYFLALADESVGTLPGTITFAPTDFGTAVSPNDFQLSRSADQHDLILTYSPVPEPGSLALLGAAAAIVGWRSRRRL